MGISLATLKISNSAKAASNKALLSSNWNAFTKTPCTMGKKAATTTTHKYSASIHNRCKMAPWRTRMPAPMDSTKASVAVKVIRPKDSA